MDDKIVAFGSSFIDSKTCMSLVSSSHRLYFDIGLTLVQFADSSPKVTLDSIVPTLEELLAGKLYSTPPSLEYLIRPDKSVALTHVAQFRNEETGTWVEAFACAHSGKILSITDFVAHASYTVVPIHKQGLLDGLETLEDPADQESSPLGWHNDGENTTTVTEHVLPHPLTHL
jgi:extracellular elastinolytic metalloproteinase